jgi:hypothetical protein
LSLLQVQRSQPYFSGALRDRSILCRRIDHATLWFAIEQNLSQDQTQLGKYILCLDL